MSIFGRRGGGGGAAASGTINTPIGSPASGESLLLTGAYSHSGYVQLVREGVPQGARQPASISGGTWLATVTPASDGTYVAELWTAASGGALLATSAAFEVLTASSPPVVTPGQTVIVAENATNPTVLDTIEYTGGVPTSWSITAGNVGSAFSISSAGVLSTAAALDHETTPSYSLTIQASNGGGSSSATVVVTVTDVLDTVPVVTPGQSFSVSEESAIGASVGTIQTTGGAPSSFSIQSGNTGSAFAINSAGAITVNAALDFETLTSYTLGIRATNAVGDSSTVNVAIGVLSAAPGTVAALTVEGTGAGANAIVHFGHPFARGDLAADAQFVAKNATDGTKYRTQITPLVLWPDGTVKHALIAVELPAIADNATLGINLAQGDAHASPGADLTLTAGLGRAISCTITPVGAGTPQTIDLTAALSGGYRIQGPLYAEKRIITSINSDAVGGAQHARLICDVVLLKDGTLTVTLAVHNTASLVSGTGTLQYDLSLSIDGLEVLDFANISQSSYKVFCRTRSTVSGGTLAVTRPFVWHDRAYLARTGFVPNADFTNGIASPLISAKTSAMAGPTWNTPLDARGIEKYMPGTGERDDIGFVPGWCVDWLLSDEREVQIYALDCAEAALGIPWHIWDHPNGRWLNAEDRPLLWADFDGRDANFFPLNGDATWTPELAHFPSACSLPYLLTGRRCFADGLMGEASYAFMGSSPQYTRGNNTPFSTVNYATGEGLAFGPYQQYRAFGWVSRSVAMAGALVPLADQPHSGWYSDATRGNLNWIMNNMAALNAATGELHGYVLPLTYLDSYFPPWQLDYVLKTYAHIKMLGYENADTILDWMLNIGAGRYLRTSDWWNGDALIYNWKIQAAVTGTVSSPFGTWQAVRDGTVTLGVSTGADHPTDMSGLGYGPSAYEAMSTARNARPQDARVARALAWLHAQAAVNPPASMPNTAVSDFRGNSRKWSVLPFGQTRAGSAAPIIPSGQAYSVVQTLGVGEAGPVIWTEGNFATSFSIQSGNTGGDWTIDNAGVLSPVNALDFDTRPTYTLGIRATNAAGNSGTVTVTINVTEAAAVAPAITPALSFSVPEAATTGEVAGTVTLTAGTLPVTFAITAGNTGSAWAINSGTGVITQAQASLDWGAVPSYSLTISATNAQGFDTETVVIDFLAQPFIPAGQAFEVAYDAANGTVVGTVSASFGPDTWAIIAADGNFAIDNAGVLTKTGALTLSTAYTPTLRASNAYGQYDEDVSITAVAASPYSPEAGDDIVVGGVAWATGASVSIGTRRTNGGKLYEAVSAGTTGATAPTHTSGTASDGAVTWLHLCAIDYTTIESWLASIPSTMTEHRTGIIWNSGAEITTATALAISGITTGSYVITLKAKEEDAFYSAASPVLAYDPSKGVAIRCTGPYAFMIDCDTSNGLTLKGLQLSSDSANIAVRISGSASLVDRCIVRGVSTPVVQVTGIVRNSVVIIDSTSTTNAALRLSSGGTAINSTIVRPSNRTAGGKGVENFYGAGVLKNCILAGFTVAPTSSWTGSYNASTNATAIPSGTGNVAIASYAAEFVQSSSASAADFRIVTGAVSKNAGTTDTTNVPDSKDILGTTRSSWDIGAHEYV